MQISRWGKSLAVRIPDVVAEAMDLKVGDDVAISVSASAERDANRAVARDAALARVRSFELELPEDWKFDRDEANAR